MDATQADIYLVSRHDRSKVIGRPYIYLAVDTATQLIAGIYIGLECDESAVMLCLANAAQNKVEFCRGHGIEIVLILGCVGLPRGSPMRSSPTKELNSSASECGNYVRNMALKFSRFLPSAQMEKAW